LPTADELAAWGSETLEQIRRELYLPDSKLYAEDRKAGAGPGGPAFAWSAGVMFSALNAAARVDPRFKPWLQDYANAVESYWQPDGTTPGFSVLPHQDHPDRYYDDNAWLALDYADAYRILGDRRYLDRAEATEAFVLSGEDDTLGGGLYWREKERVSKNTCANAPGAAAAYVLYTLTHKHSYQQAGNRLLTWTVAHLQDPADHLMWDNIRLRDGVVSIEKTKWSYNTALTMRVLAQRSRGNDLKDALAMGNSAIQHWQDPATGAFRDGAAFAHLLAENILRVDRRDRSHPFRAPVLQALSLLHTHGRDANGHYGQSWASPVDKPLDHWTLINQASAARAYFYAAAELKGLNRNDR
jgi:hypothetical protein